VVANTRDRALANRERRIARALGQHLAEGKAENPDRHRLGQLDVLFQVERRREMIDVGHLEYGEVAGGIGGDDLGRCRFLLLRAGPEDERDVWPAIDAARRSDYVIVGHYVAGLAVHLHEKAGAAAPQSTVLDLDKYRRRLEGG